VQLFGDRRRRLEALDDHVRLSRDGLHAVQQVGGVFLLRQDCLQIRQPPFQIGDLRAELRQLPRRHLTLGDVGPQRHQLRLARHHLRSHGHLVVVVEDAAAADAERDERADLRVPRQLGEGELHG
jgi:hypothetical protein